MLHNADADDDLVNMPLLGRPRRNAANAAGELWTELRNPCSDGFVAYHDAAPGEHVFNVPPAEIALQIGLDRKENNGTGKR
ncbi:MAG: hypothetical protein AAF830_17410 [Pseudomonadota bacterium]